MKASVGVGARNLREDVKYVQFLLSDHLAQGKGEALAIDGICGPKTQAAITKFQQINTGIVDGRVDPNGTMIRRLEQMHWIALVRGIKNISYLALLGARWSRRAPPL